MTINHNFDSPNEVFELFNPWYEYDWHTENDQIFINQMHPYTYETTRLYLVESLLCY